jgi:hypothetical protein
MSFSRFFNKRFFRFFFEAEAFDTEGNLVADKESYP